MHADAGAFAHRIQAADDAFGHPIVERHDLAVDLKRGGNILYLRDAEAVLARVRAAPARPIQGRMV